MTSRHPIRIAFLATSFAALAAVGACSKTPEPQAETTPAPPMTLGTQVDDAVVTSSVKSALLADDLVKSFELQVETRKGVVQLSGFVDNQAQIDQAMALTSAVQGVVNVENDVTLKGSSSTVGTKIDDAAVTTRVKTALLADAAIKSFDISVLTFKGEVQLTGFVNNQSQIDLAGQLASAAEGASSVKNDLMIKQ
ncbi:BON domain-containing protein [Hydrogenophaga sp. PAMC20947]|uniref:BON domain-containing protein n=1 Tax=Hydrogenophaga sp. PAMC20947 TaxID=2565558 RepID=UPI00109DD5B9|nr:BON domain-containing protein [Hydrogenophaga sp. PAMC20947]QCB45413.1 BON domain-containing protein [Hydrogenophaga sp. PAMC20947]